MTESKETKKMVEVWIARRTFKINKATVVETCSTCKDGHMDFYNQNHCDVVVYVDGDNVYEGNKKARKLYKVYEKHKFQH